jgi:tetratricopeptide (TPR) repeat protein
VGEPTLAVRQYERALALREAMQGASHPDAAACRNQLAVAYRLAGRTTEAALLFDRHLNSPSHASALAARGLALLLEKKPAEAELKLREALTIRRKIQPGDWTTFDTESTLGEALLDQKRFADAEKPLLSGGEGLQQRAGAIPAQDKARLTKAIERLVRLYEAWGKPDEAAKWRAELQDAGSSRGS